MRECSGFGNGEARCFANGDASRRSYREALSICRCQSPRTRMARAASIQRRETRRARSTSLNVRQRKMLSSVTADHHMRTAPPPSPASLPSAAVGRPSTVVQRLAAHDIAPLLLARRDRMLQHRTKEREGEGVKKLERSCHDTKQASIQSEGLKTHK